MCVALKCCIENLKFLEIFQKPHGGKLPTARRRILKNPNFWVLVELPGSDEYPPADANHSGSIFDDFEILGVFDRRGNQG